MNMDQVWFTQNYLAFLGLVDQTLEDRGHSSAREVELTIVKYWFDSQRIQKTAYLKAVDEIIALRKKD